MTTLLAPEPAPLGKVSTHDLSKGLVLAGIVGVVSAIIPALSAPVITIALIGKAVGIGFATGFLSYLGKQLGTNSNDEFGKKEPVK